MNVLTFGDKPAPAMAQVALQKTAEEGKSINPEAARTNKVNTYMDDILHSVNTKEEAKKLTGDIDSILERGGFKVKLKDVLKYKFEIEAVKFCTADLTKRKILSQVARIYDPIGFASPFLVRAKISLQELWEEGVDWDDELPPSIQEKWSSYFKEMEQLNDVSFERCICPGKVVEPPTSCVFADASRGKSGELCQLTPHTFAKISEYCQKWVNLDGEQSKIAANVAEFMKHWSLDSENELVPEEIANARYHKECYVRFCDKTKIERAEKRMKKKEMTVEASSHGEPSTPVINRPAPAPVRISPRTLISGSEAIPRRNRHVLPERCIICKRQDAYKVDKVTRKRKLDKLVLAETFNGGLLREAAEKKKDESILAHIRGKDCVAIEVRYHRHCHLDYCRFLTRKSTTSKPLMNYTNQATSPSVRK
ncbi:uncharacterized protein LOC114526785 [Dendronephthya gigantea]|uniref:uncharacterized protein LOC114526785 n=1 Tax=Dendronephthya gigantea TaxID=151771 RepID=UPI00106AA863|nr:uncharacterized protein LOC114526785 [Dendronephthya gigantea]